ncbi:MAG: hypothetical protein ACREFL_00785 [Stellaceae bacterium]
MTGFSRAWLKLRESADLAARDPHLARRFAAALRRQPGRALQLIDLGAGTGATCRALMPRIGGNQDWLLIDHDPSLLAAQLEEMTLWARRQGYPILAGGGRITIASGAARWHVTGRALDLARDWDALETLEADGVTASALFDLVSAEWIEHFAAWLDRRGLPLLAMLTADGRRLWEPPLPGDEQVSAGFSDHQSGDKGFGPALGGAAPAALARALSARGFDIAQAASDWRLGVREAILLAELIAGEAEAAAAARPLDKGMIEDWETGRRRLLENAKLKLAIGHRDVLALPGKTAKIAARN